MSNSRNLFTIGLVTLAVGGVVAILIATKPKEAGGAPKDISYIENKQAKTMTGYQINGDATKNAKFMDGDVKAPVTIVEFSNYLCIHCANFSNQVKSQLFSEFVDTGKVRFYSRYYVNSAQANVRTMSRASSCAADQGRFKEYDSALFREQRTVGVLQGTDLENKLVDYASQFALDTNAFKNCLKDTSKDQIADQDLKDALSFGISGTPGFIINGYRYEGEMPIEAFRAIINDASKKS